MTADFCERVVHHWVINQLNPLFDQHLFMTTMPVARGRGAHLGTVKKSEHFNFARDGWVLKLDIHAVFMARVKGHHPLCSAGPRHQWPATKATATAGMNPCPQVAA
ncbi:MAG: hypothetical protein JJT82_04645 [Legionellaceae bacterium]|nr:hypothetical protein [Legionellaceae bacterium]